jgi:hypothetical protein
MKYTFCNKNIVNLSKVTSCVNCDVMGKSNRYILAPFEQVLRIRVLDYLRNTYCHANEKITLNNLVPPEH